MKNVLKDAGLIRKYADAMHGVFSAGDLRRLFAEENPVLLHRRIAVLVEGDVITRFARGMYVTPGYSPETVAARIIEKSYLSLGTVLAEELMIGSVPAKTIYAVRVGRNRVFRGPGLTIEYVGITPLLFFGFKARQAIRYALREKALLDTLYFYMRGRTFSFDIYQDIDTSRVNRDLIDQWLPHYKNNRFVSFVKGYLHDRN